MDKTQAQLLLQKIYDGVVKQGGPAYTALKGCEYRSGKRKCAVGQLIPNAKYDPDMEGRDAEDIIHSYFDEYMPFLPLLTGLQMTHDQAAEISGGGGQSFFDMWYVGCQTLSRTYKLNCTLVRHEVQS